MADPIPPVRSCQLLADLPPPTPLGADVFDGWLLIKSLIILKILQTKISLKCEFVWARLCIGQQCCYVIEELFTTWRNFIQISLKIQEHGCKENILSIEKLNGNQLDLRDAWFRDACHLILQRRNYLRKKKYAE